VASFSSPPESIKDVNRTLEARAFLYDHPDEYLAGVHDAVAAIAESGTRVLLVDDGGREEWLRTLEQYRATCGPPSSGRARAFETKLERQLSA
jgi:hypothetical protein